MHDVANNWSPHQGAHQGDSGLTREVRLEQWSARTFYASHCRFFVDVPLDMSGIIMTVAREATQHGYRLVAGGATLATDAIYRGAVLIEIERALGNNVVQFDGEVLARVLPDKGVQIRSEFNELKKWSVDIGYEITGCYVEYAMRSSMPGRVRPHAVYATIRGEDPR
jgi:hypothetical protein